MPSSIVIFGGSFNPPHRGHWQVLEYLQDLSEFDEVWMIPTYAHPFEKDLTSFEHRLHMCELTVKGFEDKVQISSIEGELKHNPSYTVDMVLSLKQRYPHHRFTIAVGSDCKNDLLKWKSIEVIKEEADFFFFPRAGFEDSPFMNISSTTIRSLVQEGKDYSQYVLPEVKKYIGKKCLYKTPSS